VCVACLRARHQADCVVSAALGRFVNFEGSPVGRVGTLRSRFIPGGLGPQKACEQLQEEAKRLN
jgi:hypothetical protein